MARPGWAARQARNTPTPSRPVGSRSSRAEPGRFSGPGPTGGHRACSAPSPSAPGGESSAGVAQAHMSHDGGLPPNSTAATPRPGRPLTLARTARSTRPRSAVTLRYAAGHPSLIRLGAAAKLQAPHAGSRPGSAARGPARLGQLGPTRTAGPDSEARRAGIRGTNGPCARHALAGRESESQRRASERPARAARPGRSSPVLWTQGPERSRHRHRCRWVGQG